MLEPESLQSQQAASVCRQPRSGAKHSLSGVLTSLYKHTHTHTGRELRPPSQQTYQCMTWPGKERPDSSEKTVDVDMLDSSACH